MRCAIATDGASVSAHFGRCPSFTIVDIDGKKVTGREVLANPGHEPGLIPQLLHTKGVECIVAGGMGMRASDLFASFGITAIVGIDGAVEDVIAQLAKGTLRGGESLCKPGAGKGYGLDKTVCDHDGAEPPDHSRHC